MGQQPKERSSGSQDDEEAPQDSDNDEPEKPHSRRPLIIAAILFVIAAFAFLIYWLATAGEITTDDAYTDGVSVAVAANVSGYVTGFYINDNMFVRRGQTLLVIDPRENQAALRQAEAALQLARAELAVQRVNFEEIKVRAPAEYAQAKAQLAQAEAQETLARRNYGREAAAQTQAEAATAIDQAAEQLRAAQAAVAQAQAQLAIAGLIPQQLQSAGQTVHQQQAQLVQAEANLAQARVKLSYNTLTAPADGYITMRQVNAGNYVQAGQQLFYIVTRNVWITANFKETQLAHMRPGERATLSVDAYPFLHLHGHVQSIQLGSGAEFSAFPAENATGNFVKIVRRVPVKIVIDSGLPANFPLPLGISAEPTVYEK